MFQKVSAAVEGVSGSTRESQGVSRAHRGVSGAFHRVSGAIHSVSGALQGVSRVFSGVPEGFWAFQGISCGSRQSQGCYKGSQGRFRRYPFGTPLKYCWNTSETTLKSLQRIHKLPRYAPETFIIPLKRTWNPRNPIEIPLKNLGTYLKCFRSPLKFPIKHLKRPINAIKRLSSLSQRL